MSQIHEAGKQRLKQVGTKAQRSGESSSKMLRQGEVFDDQGDALITAIGALNEWRWPQIPGLHDFGGKLLHSAAWDESYDYKVSTS